MRKKLATPFGKEEYAKRITVAEAPFGNLKYNMRLTHLNHRGLKKAKGECLLHVIGHNLGVLCRNVSIEQVNKLNSIRPSLNHDGNSVDSVDFSRGAWHRPIGNDDKNGFGIVEFGFAM